MGGRRGEQLGSESVRIRLQAEDFSPADQERWLRQDDCDVGALVSFTGCVRDRSGERLVSRLRLEHYPGMTEKSLAGIVDQAAQRWNLLRVSVIHRVGDLYPGDRIVFVGVTSAHRGSAFAACEYIMDFLKSRAPFWKKEWTDRGAYWVEPRDSDARALERW